MGDSRIRCKCLVGILISFASTLTPTLSPRISFVHDRFTNILDTTSRRHISFLCQHDLFFSFLVCDCIRSEATAKST